MPRKPPAPSAPKASDDALWNEVAKSVKPLRGRKRPPSPGPAELPPQSVRTVAKRNPVPPSPKPRGSAPRPELAAGAVDALDRRLGERLRRGQLPIDAKLDLHGHVYESGAREVAAFITSAHERGARLVLIVTGKGSRSRGEGVLRQSLPRWLNAPGLRDRILAFSAAQPRHGGDGAFYVLLKRLRRLAAPGSADNGPAR
ncbi:MAG: Smr/MutS family protein [Alphaproteobacteria bacterium]